MISLSRKSLFLAQQYSNLLRSTATATTTPSTIVSSSSYFPRRARMSTTNSNTTTTTTSNSPPSFYHCVHVHVQTKPGTEEDFLQATLLNAQQSVFEKGILRFDVLQDSQDPTQFCLVEIYTDREVAPAAHKETVHYQTWRETVADMMAVPRQAKIYRNCFPSTTPEAWEYTATSGGK